MAAFCRSVAVTAQKGRATEGFVVLQDVPGWYTLLRGQTSRAGRQGQPLQRKRKMPDLSCPVPTLPKLKTKDAIKYFLATSDGKGFLRLTAAYC